jgi:PilX N-terminal
MEQIMRPIGSQKQGEKGIVLVLALLMLLVLTLIGVSGMSTTDFETLIAGNKRVSSKAFYVAEAGINEFMGRFRTGATGEFSDSSPTSPNWRLFLAINAGKATRIGYSSATTGHNFLQSLQNELDFAVEARHKLDASNNVVVLAGYPVYIVTSHGYTAEGGHKVIEVEVTKSPYVEPPASLYSKSPVNLQGSSTYISGIDHCPADGVANNKPGIITTTPTITQAGNPTVEGDPPKVTDSPINLHINDMVTYLKGDADFTYEYTTNQTLTGLSNDWGTPAGTSTTEPLSYDGPMNIVYFDMNGDRTLTLAGGSHGAGILLVNGNLELNGGFKWYGVIIVTGALDYTGGGQKNVTGGIMAGETTTVQLDVGGNAGIINCSSATKKIKVAPLKITQWREMF